MLSSLFESLWWTSPAPAHELPPKCRDDNHVEPRRYYTELKQRFPDMTDSELLNANNKKVLTPEGSSVAVKADVVVVGGGILGLCYAIQLKTVAPFKQIVVLEKSKAPKYKIGESTLSSFSRWVNTYVLDSVYLLRLFGAKEGLSFYCVEETGERVSSVDIGKLDISYQLDRRVSDLFLTLWAQRLGVQVYHGVSLLDVVTPDHLAKKDAEGMSAPTAADEPNNSLVSDATSLNSDDPFKKFESSVTWQSDGGGVAGKLTTRMVCDASGFGRKVTGDFGARESFDGWNHNAHWAYFKDKEVPGPIHEDLREWDLPTTRHICFPEGWGWFIRLISWEHAPLPNLMDMLLHVIELGVKHTTVDELPSTKELSGMFGCPHEFITSIGWAVRDDAPVHLEPGTIATGETMFRYYQKKYPVLDQVMENRYVLLERYYDKRTYFTIKKMSFKSPVVAGRGWMAIGNSVGFTNPLFSPGINAGIGTSMEAADLTDELHRIVKWEDSTTVDASVDAKTQQYTAYIQDFMLPRLEVFNRFQYFSFRDPRLYVECIKVIMSNASSSIYQYHASAGDKQWLVGAGADDVFEAAKDIIKYIEGPADVKMTEQEVETAVQVMRGWIRRGVARCPTLKWSIYSRHTDDFLMDVPGKNEKLPGGVFKPEQCASCHNWKHVELTKCTLCGVKSM
ncbi:hypothetical protein Gpo141_00008540 [Globisporangium polare]